MEEINYVAAVCNEIETYCLQFLNRFMRAGTGRPCYAVPYGEAHSRVFLVTFVHKELADNLLKTPHTTKHAGTWFVQRPTKSEYEKCVSPSLYAERNAHEQEQEDRVKRTAYLLQKGCCSARRSSCQRNASLMWGQIAACRR